MLKGIDRVRAQVTRAVEQDMWAVAVREAREGVAAGAGGAAVGASGAAGDATGRWPLAVALGTLSKKDLVDGIGAVVAYGSELSAWAARMGLEVMWESRRAGGLQRVPTHVIVPTIDAGARIAGREVERRLALARRRAAQLAEHFPAVADKDFERVLKLTTGWAELDFQLLVAAADWFAAHDATGLTPRQVPLPGFHAKWLDAAGRRGLVCTLCGKGDLGLVERRPTLVEFAYLDPDYLAGGGRRYDSHLAGDVGRPAYAPSLVVVVENRDSYLAFPQVAGGICVFGAGRAGVAALPEIDWVAAAPRLLYWGDMDAAGLEILDAYRAAGLPMESLLMDVAAYKEHRCFGTKMTAGKQPLADHRAQSVPHLAAEELELYELLTSPDFDGPRRIEQERIPLAAALLALGGRQGVLP